jgi:hypothetical protein
MAALFTLVGWSALPWLKRPEAWLITLILMLGVQAPFMGRFMMGRPFMWSMLALVTILFLWHARGSSPPDKRSCAAMTGLIALAVLLHGVWYFWALPVAAFFSPANSLGHGPGRLLAGGRDSGRAVARGGRWFIWWRPGGRPGA